MKKFLAIIGIAVVGSLIFASPSFATDENIPIESSCLTGLYVNHDEGGSDPNQGDRRPTQTENGLKFEDNQLVHHATDLDVSELIAGIYTADPKVTSPSFFSVEVAGEDGGYATLRWVEADNIWSMTTGGQTYTDADPVALVSDHNKSHHVFSFGVGYTNAPHNYPAVVVSSITFKGTTYDLTCKPSPKPSRSHVNPPRLTPTRSTNAASLPVTGNNTLLLGSIALLCIGVGGLAVIVARKRRTF